MDIIVSDKCVLVESVGGVHYRLHLCGLGSDLHAAWNLAILRVRFMPANPKVRDRMIDELQSACLDYWNHRHGIRNCTLPCPKCRMEMDLSS